MTAGVPLEPQPATTAAHALAARILDALPQTQCKRCGYPDCAGYANAIAAGEANINQCPPGGGEGVARLAHITSLPARTLDPAFGVEGPRQVAFIDENWCIGCTLCIDACPTDAIVGSNKRMHTVIEPYCTGCELCLPVCPVDCILLENTSGTATGWSAWPQTLADTARTRYAFHGYKAQRDEEDTNPQVLDPKRAVIQAALARSRAKRQAAK